MPRSTVALADLELPPEPNADLLPRYLAKVQTARVHRKYYGPISPRTISETWGLEWIYLNGYAVTPTAAFLTEAKRRFDAAPVIRGGRKPSDANALGPRAPHGRRKKELVPA
jgi:hypothetical protein